MVIVRMFGIKHQISWLFSVLYAFSVFSAIVGFASPSLANPKVPRIFSDGMVLQRDKPIRIWGAAEPGELIGVKIADQASVVTADDKGRWGVTLKPIAATGTPLELVIHGKSEIVIHDVLMGEVWLCAGQSNMGLPYRKIDHSESDTNLAMNSTLRLFKLNNDESAFVPQTDPHVHWTAPTKEEVEKFSGVGLFFGMDLYKNLNVPIGLIQSAHGGASLETFVSRKSIDTSNEFKSIGTNSDKSFALYQDSMDQYKKDLQTWFANGKTGKQPEEPSPPRMKKASVAFDTLLAPVAPFAMRGAIFYQGEADVYLSALRYRRLFALMVSDWRNQFKDPTLPIIFVQLPNYGAKQKAPEDSDWAIMRETQAICRRIPYTYMVVTLDTIPGADAGMHATQKKEIARRLASVALATQYHISRPYASPIYDSMQIDGNKVRIKFRYADKGLISNSLPITGFEIAGENKRWTNADAQVDGDCVIVSSPRVPSPTAVRYGWADNPTVNLYSADKLPVTPFRTDDWPRLTQKKSY
ncbi:MAG: hypothetical protein JST44_12490 [Cyanobacteria bacterium SZAS LIN-5]|nr:hypothetical protein [Cyanobacteria bacterium SZAS LIN-5]